MKCFDYDQFKLGMTLVYTKNEAIGLYYVILYHHTRNENLYHYTKTVDIAVQLDVSYDMLVDMLRPYNIKIIDNQVFFPTRDDVKNSMEVFDALVLAIKLKKVK